MTHPFDDYSVQVIGYVGGQQAYSAQLLLSQSPQFVSLGWSDVDSIRFLVAFNTGYLVMDDVAYAPVPLPAAGWPLLLGLGGLALLRRRKAH